MSLCNLYIYHSSQQPPPPPVARAGTKRRRTSDEQQADELGEEVCSMSDVIMIEDGQCSTGTVLKVNSTVYWCDEGAGVRFD